jgi:NTP pyrophosphatase (non-canonical NTP hydrolase)
MHHIHILHSFQTCVKNYKNPKLTEEQALSNWALGLAGETGEVVEIIKKVLYQDQEMSVETKKDLEEEMGDVFWYLFALADEVGLDVEGILQKNIEKLTARHGKSGYDIKVANVNKEKKPN